ncbi:uncharacterized protein BX664DRAFT_388097 [Halteromyces radiatus]|uniref:uncharacterized protein n=1 Tax=Halteromyces radiatus TaxID=101107 RepID=UPI0022200E99|nr:uncharacterized protein BX664DRAFT_388097 [Halteromyces radiatus]KAI8082979.1 hypothetical protein BX664DRAFT_388097 [Halteromyces radiatus]
MDPLLLPAEIFEKIILLLPRQQFFEYRLVSRGWQKFRLFDHCQLYHTVNITNVRRMQSFLLLLLWSAKQHHIASTNFSLPIGHYVRQLYIEQSVSINHTRFVLLQSLCPFVEFFEHYSSSRLLSTMWPILQYHDDNPSNQDFLASYAYPSYAYPGWPYLKNLMSHHTDTPGYLMHHYSQQLTHLTIALFHRTGSYFWPLPSLPCLYEIQLRYMDLDGDSLDTMNTSAPQLTTLRIDTCRFLPMETTAAAAARPLTSLRTLEFEKTEVLDSSWRIFFLTRYPNLEKFNINFSRGRQYPSHQAEMVAGFPRLRILGLETQYNKPHESLLHYLRLKNSIIGMEDIRLENFWNKAMEDIGNATYMEGYCWFIGCLQPTLKSLHISPPSLCPGVCLVDMMKPLSFCHDLTTLTLNLFGSPPDHPVDIPSILDACRNLDSLELSEGVLTASSVTSSSSTSSSPTSSSSTSTSPTSTSPTSTSPTSTSPTSTSPTSTSPTSTSSTSSTYNSKLAKLVLVNCSFDSSLFGYINKSCKNLEKLAIRWFELSDVTPPWETTTQDERCIEINLPDVGLEICTLDVEAIIDLVVITGSTQKEEEKRFYMPSNDREYRHPVSFNEVPPRLPYYEDETQWPSLTATVHKDYYWKQMDPLLDGSSRYVSDSVSCLTKRQIIPYWRSYGWSLIYLLFDSWILVFIGHSSYSLVVKSHLYL